MTPIWVLVADEGRGRVLELRQPHDDLVEVEDFADPAARVDEAALRRDAHGRRSGGGGDAPGADMVSGGPTKEQHEAALFARHIAGRLLAARREGRYERLRIAAAPRFLGVLRQELPDEVRAAVTDEIDSDLLNFDPRALTRRLFGDQNAAQR